MAATSNAETRESVRRIVDVPGIADYLRISLRHVRRLIAERRIPHYKVGHLIRFDLDEIDTWFDATHRGPDGDRPAA